MTLRDPQTNRETKSYEKQKFDRGRREEEEKDDDNKFSSGAFVCAGSKHRHQLSPQSDLMFVNR